MQLYKHFTANNIQLEPFPFRRELSMESYLIENEGVLGLDNDIFSDVEIIEAELTLKEGRQSNNKDGRIDILASYAQEYIAVIELKLGRLEDKHLSQLEDYLKGRNNLLTKYSFLIGQSLSEQPKWLGILVGTSINSKLADKINNGYQTTDNIQIAALIIQRYRGNDGQIYITTETFFSKKLSLNDTTKYLFNQSKLGKSRLVLEVIKFYVDTHGEVSYSDLVSKFPLHLQGNLGTFATIEEATEIHNKTGHKRNYIKPNEQIKLSDCVIAVSNQWGIGNIKGFINHAEVLGYEIRQAT